MGARVREWMCVWVHVWVCACVGVGECVCMGACECVHGVCSRGHALQQWVEETFGQIEGKNGIQLSLRWLLI